MFQSDRSVLTGTHLAVTTTNWQIKLPLKYAVFCVISVLSHTYSPVLLLYLKKGLQPPFFLIQRKSWSESLFCWTGTFFEKGGDYHNFPATPPLYVHPAFKSHKITSNASCVQVSTANFIQTSHSFWTTNASLGQLRGILCWESYAGLPPGSVCPVQETTIQGHVTAWAEDPSPRVIPPVFWPHASHNLKAKGMQGIGLLIHALGVLWRGCRRWRQTECTSWLRLRVGNCVYRENDGRKLLIHYNLKSLQPFALQNPFSVKWGMILGPL